MNFLNIFEDHVAGIFGATRAPFSFKKLAKQAAREMEEQTLVINGVNTAPALYTILIANDDDPLMAPYYPQLTREVAEFVKAQAEKKNYVFVGEPLVRFMIDPSLRGGRFSVFAENVDSPTLGRLYEEERAYQQGLSQSLTGPAAPQTSAPQQRQQTPQPRRREAPAPQPQPRRAAASLAGTRVPDVSAPADPAGYAAAGAMGAAAGAVAGAAAAGAASGRDPFVSLADPAAPIPVPQTVTRAQIDGMGGAAATGGAITGAQSIANNMVGSRAQVGLPPLAQLVDVVTGDVYEVSGQQCVIGRERAATDVTLRDPNVSRRHAQLTFTGQDWSIEDLNSTNGTLVNNRRITRCPLRDGDLVTFGLSTFEFRG